MSFSLGVKLKIIETPSRPRIRGNFIVDFPRNALHMLPGQRIWRLRITRFPDLKIGQIDETRQEENPYSIFHLR